MTTHEAREMIRSINADLGRIKEMAALSPAGHQADQSALLAETLGRACCVISVLLDHIEELEGDGR